MDRNVRKPGWRGFLPRPPRQIGRRGMILMLLGICWIFMGLAIYETPISSYGLIQERLPYSVRSAIWIVTGTVALVYAWRPTGFDDAPAFLALYIPPVIRLFGYLLEWGEHVFTLTMFRLSSFLDMDTTWEVTGMPSGWRFAIFYAAILSTIFVTSGWEEPTRPEELGLEEDNG